MENITKPAYTAEFKELAVKRVSDGQTAAVADKGPRLRIACERAGSPNQDQLCNKFFHMEDFSNQN